LPFQLNFIGESVYLERINELLFLWENNGSFVFKTSGTTGAPKEFSFSRQQVETAIQSTVAYLELMPRQEHILLCLDPNFIAGAMMLLRAKYLDCAITVCKASNNLWQSIAINHPYTFASFVPPQLVDASFDDQKFARIHQVLIGGMSLDERLRSKVVGKGNQVFLSYGMTETLSHIALKNLNKPQHYQLIGGNKIAVTPQNTLVITTPFLSHSVITNDVAEVFNDGSFNVLGRSDFVINSGAYKVNPESIEATIKEHAGDFIEAAGNTIIIGVPDKVLGEKVWLLSERKITNESFDQLLEILSKYLHKYQLPKGFDFYGPFEQTVNGKVSRKQIINNFIISTFGLNE
jgi:O-succinylbenzoic acid--CoA ligase